MYTTKLFKTNKYLKKTGAIITSVTTYNSATLLTFNQTIFFPTGGGQTCDIGKVTKNDGGRSDNFAITDVYEKDNEIYHIVDSSPDEFSVGDEIILEIDWDHRFDNMQRHCGEHILSGAFYRLYNGANKGFHMGEDYMTVDIAFDEGSPYDKVTWAMASAAELDANRVIWSDEPVTIDYFETRSEAEKMPLRKVLAFDEDISIVTIGEKSNPDDCVACCGTHPSTTGQVGMIKIYKIEPNKGMSRIFFECGARALAQYQQQFNVLYDLGNKLSAGFTDIIEKYDVQQAKDQAVRDRLHELSRQLVSIRTQRIQSDVDAVSDNGRTAGAGSTSGPLDDGITAGAGSTSGPLKVGPYEFSDLSADDIMKIGNRIGETSATKTPMMIPIVDLNSMTLFLFGIGSVDCGQVVKSAAAEFNGKGGGNAKMSRCKFPTHEALADFINKINKE